MSPFSLDFVPQLNGGVREAQACAGRPRPHLILGRDGGSVGLVLKGLKSSQSQGLIDFCSHLRPHILGLLCSRDLCPAAAVPGLRFQRVLCLGQLGERSAAAGRSVLAAQPRLSPCCLHRASGFCVRVSLRQRPNSRGGFCRSALIAGPQNQNGVHAPCCHTPVPAASSSSALLADVPFTHSVRSLHLFTPWLFLLPLECARPEGSSFSVVFFLTKNSAEPGVF